MHLFELFFVMIVLSFIILLSSDIFLCSRSVIANMFLMIMQFEQFDFYLILTLILHNEMHRFAINKLLLQLRQLFYGSLDFVRDNLDEPVPEETFTHSHLSWSSIIPYLLPPSTTIYAILPVQFTLPDSLFAQ